jgi:hypothetical protein
MKAILVWENPNPAICCKCGSKSKSKSGVYLQSLDNQYICGFCFNDIQFNCKEGYNYCEECGELYEEEETIDVYYENEIPHDRICYECYERYGE